PDQLGRHRRQRTQHQRAAARSRRQKADAVVFKQRVSAEFLAAGGQPDALDFVCSKAPFTLGADGELQPKDAGTPTLKDWLAGQAIGSLAFAFNPSSGGGARGSKPGAVPGTRSNAKISSQSIASAAWCPREGHRDGQTQSGPYRVRS